MPLSMSMQGWPALKAGMPGSRNQASSRACCQAGRGKQCACLISTPVRQPCTAAQWHREHSRRARYAGDLFAPVHQRSTSQGDAPSAGRKVPRQVQGQQQEHVDAAPHDQQYRLHLPAATNAVKSTGDPALGKHVSTLSSSAGMYSRGWAQEQLEH
jgi:hypothetical protein